MKKQVLFGTLALLASQAFAQQAVVTGPDARLNLDFQLQDGCVHIYSTAHSSRYAIGKLKSCEVMLKSESAQLYKAAPSLGVYGVFVHHFYLVH